MKFQKFNNYINQNKKLLHLIIFSLIIFSILRVVYLFRFGNEAISYIYSSEIMLALLNGIRFDLQIILYSFLPILLINFFALSNNDKQKRIINKISIYFTSIILSVHVLILIIDQQFYTYFQTHLNILVFAFIEDDTTAVLSSMWTDHPVIKILIFFTFYIFIQTKILKYIIHKTRKEGNTLLVKRIAFLFIFLSCYGIGLRGSLGVFPLQVDNATVGSNPFINILSLNGQFTFKDAIKEHALNNSIISASDYLKEHKYASIDQVIIDYYGKDPIKEGGNYTDYLFPKTKKDTFLSENPPNIVFIMMESFGYYYLKFHDKNELNLLGALEKNIKEDLFFTNFLSSTRGTIYSLENIVLNNTEPIISSSQKRFNSYKSSVAYPYHSQGYETIFVSGGKIGWRNLFEWLPKQYFNSVYGSHTIKRNNPKALNNTWGVFDEFLFDDIFNQLEKNSQAKMIWALSTTNHTPYELPKTYKALPLNVSDSLYSQFIANKETALKNLKAYQYANQKLGEFIDRIKQSPLGENTIIAVTGDHNSYALFPYNSTGIDEKYKHTVPFYLYVPEKYRKGVDYKALQNRSGSHKDIFPTLFNLSLSDQEYCSLGNDLLSSEIPDNMFYGINSSYTLFDKKANKWNITKKVRAQKVLSKYQIIKSSEQDSLVK